MVRTLVVGIDTDTGHSLAQNFAEHFDVGGLWYKTAEVVDGCHSCRIGQAALTQQIAESDVIVFCGGASRSSWDTDFGDFEAEQQWLSVCIDAIKSSGKRLMFVSSDAVFGSPWVFHNDDSDSLARNRVAKQLLKYEAQVAAVSDSLILRTNALAATNGNLLPASISAIRDGRSIELDAGTFATPIDANTLGEMVTQCVNSDASGYINIGAAERTTPFHFITALAKSLNLPTDSIEAVKCSGRPVERSMRCQRLRSELQRQMPLMQNTLEYFTDLLCEVTAESLAA